MKNYNNINNIKEFFKKHSEIKKLISPNTSFFAF